jgi:Spy/CpxP family protein refolding chaperone
MMQLQLIKGRFNKNEAFDLVSQMVNIKIKYHEGKIRVAEKEEDIKMRESRIKQLQKELHEFKSLVLSDQQAVNIESGIIIA